MRLLVVVRARGLALTTDPDRLSLRPVAGWRVGVDDEGAITVGWPHSTPLLTAVPLQVPDGWQEAAAARGVVVMFAGHGLGLHDPHADGNGHATARLWAAAAAGALAGGAVTVAGHEARAADLDSALARPWRRASRHDAPARTRGGSGRHRAGGAATRTPNHRTR